MKRGRGRPPKPFEELTDDGRRKRLQKMAAQQPPSILRVVPPVPAARKTAAEAAEPLPITIAEEIDVQEFMRRVMLGQINPTARQLAAARSLMAMQPKPAASPAEGGGEIGKKQQQAGAAAQVAGGSKYNPTPPPSRLRAA